MRSSIRGRLEEEGISDQLNSEVASDPLPSLRAGVREKEHLLPVPESAAFGIYMKPLPCVFLALSSQREKGPSSLLKTSQVSHRGTRSFWAGCLRLVVMGEVQE